MAGNSGLIECAICGATIGSGLPGGGGFCEQCGEIVATRAARGDVGAIVGPLIALGIGIAATVALVSLLRSTR